MKAVNGQVRRNYLLGYRPINRHGQRSERVHNDHNMIIYQIKFHRIWSFMIKNIRCKRLEIRGQNHWENVEVPEEIFRIRLNLRRLGLQCKHI